ncbi:late secretory pathway protein AVL9 homolog isoform X2 [Lasioglossum baleicum]|uniref:late secretory pathway protein AVL9 homolog isoform X2 n=1 Tax=Lasioglossum baleicum TaxID=434251 RepID=UPI003FCD832D
MAESVGPILHVIVVGFHHKKGCQKLKNRTSDITRGTVQKSVCVLSTLPLYGHIQVKMALITHAYFEEGDFSKVSLLEDTYHHLNSCMSSESQIPPQVFVGLSARDFILQFRHKVLLLFKLLLLEKKIVFYQSPVQPLCAAILTLLSLFPYMIESGLQQAAYVRPSRPMSPVPTFDEEDIVHSIDNNVSSINSVKDNISDTVTERVNGNSNKHSDCINDNKAVESMEDKCMDEFNNLSLQKNNNENENLNMKVIEVESAQECTETYAAEENNTTYSRKPNDHVHRVQSVNTITLGATDTDDTLPRDTSNDALSDARLTNNITQIAHINPEFCGLPLNLFTKGYLCLPYLSLPYLDLLADVNVRGYIVGVTNVLFKQKKQLIDVLVEVENMRIETTDPDLRRQLHLTTEDLRFADYIVRHVAEPRKDIFLDGVGWEGGDEWIRTQFRVYLLSMLRTSMQQDTRQSDHYNSAFIAAWRATNNYEMWSNSDKPEINNIEPGHPFAGQLSVQDMKLRLSHTMQNTESGRKLNQAMASTGRAVATTGKAVGGALSQAKGAFSNWWSTLTTVQPVEEGKPDNQTPNIHQTLSNMTNKTTIEDEEMNVSTNDASLEVVLD